MYACSATLDRQYVVIVESTVEKYPGWKKRKAGWMDDRFLVPPAILSLSLTMGYYSL